jgi:uncharacterized membrane protein
MSSPSPISYGRTLGVTASLAIVLLWAVFLLRERAAPGTTMMTSNVAVFMLLIGLIALGASWRAKPIGMLVAFAASFLPVGLYVLASEGFYRLIGVADLLLLAAALLLLREYERQFMAR